MSVQNSGGLGGAPRGFGGAGNGNDSRQPSNSFNERATNNLSRLAGAVMTSARSVNAHGQQTDGSEGFRAFSYNNKNSEGIFGDMFGATKELNDDQYRADVIDQASYKGFELYQALFNRTGVYYMETKNAMEFFKRDKMGVIQPCFELFINEVESNLQLYRYCASYASTFFASDLVTIVFAGNIGEVISDIKKQLSLLQGNFVNVLCLQYLCWLEYHPDALTIIQQMTPQQKARVQMFETMIDQLQTKLINISIGNATFPFPWKKGSLKRIADRTQVKSTLLEGYDFHQPDTIGSLGHYESRVSTTRLANGNVDAYNVFSTLTNQSNANVHVRSGGNQVEELSTAGGSWGGDSNRDNLLEMVKRINPNNRMDFRFHDYFVRVPGIDDERYLAHPDYFRYISRTLTLRTEENKMPFHRGVWAALNMVPLIRIDWKEGCYDYQLLSLEGMDVLTVLTNPDKVLPQIKADPGMAALQAFDEYIKETSDIVDKDKNPVSIPECKTLDKEPKILFGNRPVDVDTNEEIISTISSLSNHYDPNLTLDAFVIPFRTKKLFQMETGIDVEDVYALFPSLVKEHCNAATIKDFYQEMKRGLERCDSEEIAVLIKHHLTNIANRWLVECRFYPESKEEPGFLALDDFIDDFEYFMAYLTERDEPSAKAFFNLTKNEFLREQFTLFGTKESRDKYVEHELTKYKDEMLQVKTKLYASAMVIERDLIVAKINPMQPLSGFQQVVLAQSAVPAFDRVIQKSHEILQKHFDRKVPVLVMFEKDAGVRVWVATESEFDNNVYSVRPISMATNIQLMNIVK